MLYQVERIGALSKEERRRKGEALARRMLQEYTGRPAASFNLARTEAGKPYTENGPEFNLSHSGEFLACAVSDRPIGIDIEAVRPLKIEIARRVCTPSELDYIAPATEGAHLRFLQVWTAKEAYFKALGTGIAGLQSVCYFDLLPRLQRVETEAYILTIYQ